ncbi:hypothetical protein [Halostagnicola sp. A56]|uniref:hypothetical protein n=1 Tax=Halostagnicola sp. A56 TaxID=1495067 RepID=UPI0012E140B4|nr:hypothetical protein [Halostagnicola sp. A56]
MQRRGYLGGIVVAGAIGIAGCAANSDDTGNGNNESKDDTDEGNGGVEIEYTISEPQTHDKIPEEVIEHLSTYSSRIPLASTLWVIE